MAGEVDMVVGRGEAVVMGGNRIQLVGYPTRIVVDVVVAVVDVDIADDVTVVSDEEIGGGGRLAGGEASWAAESQYDCS